MKRSIIYFSERLFLVLMFICTYSINLEGVNKFTILSRWNPKLERFNYVIKCLTIPTQKQNKNHIETIQLIIEHIPNSKFLFFDNDSNLFDYALMFEKQAEIIKGPFTFDDCKIQPTIQRIANVVKSFIESVEQDACLVQKTTEAEKGNDNDNLFLSNAFGIYLKYFNNIKGDMENWKSDLQNIASLEKEEDVHKYLINKFKNITDIPMLYNLYYFQWLLMYPDLRCFNVFKTIVEKQEIPNIFVFDEYNLQFDYLIPMLVELGYNEVYTYTCDDLERSFGTINILLNTIRESLIENSTQNEDIEIWEQLFRIESSSLHEIFAEKVSNLISINLDQDKKLKDFLPIDDLTVNARSVQCVIPISLKDKGKEKEID